MSQEWEYIVSASEKKQRLDQFLAAKKELNLSRSQIQKLIKNKNIVLNGQATKVSYQIKLDDRIKVIIPPPPKLEVKPEPIPLDIVYEDGDLIVVNKPKGMVVHPAPGNYSGTLVNAMLYHCKSLASLGSPLRPGIVHRLDKDTSGLLVVAKNDFSYQSLVEQVKDRMVERTYVALVHGVVKNNQGEIVTQYGRHPVYRKKFSVYRLRLREANRQALGVRRPGKEAITYYRVLQRFKNYTLLEVKIKTGRTHQIRVHMSYIGHPVVGDLTYGKRENVAAKLALPFKIKGQLLHAKKLGFIHPRLEKYLEFESEIPSEMKKILQEIK